MIIGRAHAIAGTMSARMSGPITSVGEALDALVHQFADPWAFLRELVQNAIDAGAAQIDVDLEHDPARGALVVRVSDTGEGMNREIIDTRLTRLFASSKEGDYTKIGRFGIGFVSVFALDPELVCVDTGRAGEHWRVLFNKDRSFERIRLDHPVEGTTVRLFLAGGPETLEPARSKARATLEHWCRHVRVELRLCGETISAPFDLDGLCKVEHAEEGTQLVMAVVPEHSALRGYYHGGLTLHLEHDDRLPHIAFKLDSRFLEHSLTRDNVIRDEHHAKALAIVDRVARGRLLPAVFAALEDPRHPARALLVRVAALALAREPEPAWLTRPVVPGVDGPAYTLADLRERPRGARVYRAAAANPVSERLAAAGHRVIACAEDDPTLELVQAATGEAPLATTDLCTVVPLRDDEDWSALARAVAELLRGAGFKVSAVTAGHLDYPGSTVADRAAISQREPGEVTPVAEAASLVSGWFSGGRALVLNADDRALGRLRRLAAREPEVAAFLAVKAFLAGADRPHEHDAGLVARAAEARWRRMA
jgi:hypothetical protein